MDNVKSQLSTDSLIQIIYEAEAKESVTNEMVATVLDNLNAGYKEVEAKVGVHPITVEETDSADLVIVGDTGNAIISVANGHVKTALFDSENVERQISSLRSEVRSAAAHPISVQDINDADFAIADSSGNRIFTVANGHIKTAKFNSADVNSSGSGSVVETKTPHRLKGKKLSILGDSISTFSGYIPSGYNCYFPYGDITSVAQMWWKQVINGTEMTLLVNCSWSGSLISGTEAAAASTSSADCGCSDRRVSDLSKSGTAPDVIILWMGINDWGHAKMFNRPLGSFDPTKDIPETSTFVGAYTTAIKKIASKYPNAEIWCCTLPCSTAQFSTLLTKQFPWLNGFGVPLSVYNDAIRSIAQMCGVHIIDLDQCGFTPWNSSTFTQDGLHPNAKGQALIATHVLKCIS